MGVEGPWDSLAKQHGRVAVMNPSISEEQLDAETNRQIDIIFPMIVPLLNEYDQIGLDYGCGAGRFTRALTDVMNARFVVGFDPCQELLRKAPVTSRIDWESGAPESFFFRSQGAFDVSFTAMVLCLPHVDVIDTAAGLSRVTREGGLVVVIDHMTDRQPEGKWVQFRPEKFYIDLFESFGVRLEKIGDDRQLSNPISILAGRKG